MANRVLIVDDNPLDRESLKSLLDEIDASISVSEVDNLTDMFKRLKKPCDLLLLDISLDSSDRSNSAGLEALRELLGEYPQVPIAIVTGYYYDKVQEFLSYLGASKQLINYIDKARISEQQLEQTIQKADKYRSEFREKLLGEDRAKQYFEAFTGSNWVSRVTAEAYIPDLNGRCNINGMLIWVEVEDMIRNCISGPEGERMNISMKMSSFKRKYQVDDKTANLMNQSMFIRNNFVHQKVDITKSDAMVLCQCHEKVRNVVGMKFEL